MVVVNFQLSTTALFYLKFFWFNSYSTTLILRFLLQLLCLKVESILYWQMPNLQNEKENAKVKVNRFVKATMSCMVFNPRYRSRLFYSCLLIMQCNKFFC